MHQALCSVAMSPCVLISRTRLCLEGWAPTEENLTAHVTARSAIKHDGTILGGRIWEPEGADNYLAELAAQLDAANKEDAGGRIIVVFDATSPVQAMRKFRRLCHRRKQGRLAGEWLEALFRLLDRQEVVVFLWQTSHVGSPMNEWADLEAAKAGNGPVVPVVRLPSEYYSMKFTMPKKSTHEWAAPLACEVVGRRLREATDESQFHSEFDMPKLTLPDRTQRTCEAVLAQRCLVGDKKKYVGGAAKRHIGCADCPFGCIGEEDAPEKFTWFHAQFECARDAVQQRSALFESVPPSQTRAESQRREN